MGRGPDVTGQYSNQGQELRVCKQEDCVCGKCFRDDATIEDEVSGESCQLFELEIYIAVTCINNTAGTDYIKAPQEIPERVDKKNILWFKCMKNTSL